MTPGKAVSLIMSPNGAMIHVDGAKHGITIRQAQFMWGILRDYYCKRYSLKDVQS